MVRLNIRRKKSGVPILSKDQIDDIGEALVADFCPEAMRYPQPINIDLFAQDYLQMEMDYQYLSHCGIYLGMTVFNDTNKVVVYDPDKNRAEYISAKAGTIIIDNNLLEEKQEHRYRFTMGHEAPGHGILHKEYFHYDPNQLTLFDMSDKVMIQCRTDGKQKRKKDQRFWTDIDWMGKIGDQTLSENQNKTLAESDYNGVEVHLFEVDDPGKYTYSGVVKLAGEPYQETQPDDNGTPRKVWMFPLQKVSEVKVVPVEKTKTIVVEEPKVEPEKNFDSQSITEQSKVFHNKFGSGVVTQIADGKIYVDFQRGQRIFQYPDAFEKGYLKL